MQAGWVDHQGSRLDFEGGITQANSYFARRVATPGGAWQRMVFRDVKKDSLTFAWERCTDDGMTRARPQRIRSTRRKQADSHAARRPGTDEP
jgi:hypothetical protein